MKNFAFLVVLLSLGVFAVSCSKTEPKTIPPPSPSGSAAIDAYKNTAATDVKPDAPKKDEAEKKE